MKKNNKLEEMFTKCIEEMRQPILELGKKYPQDVVNNAMIELGLRMLLLRVGTTHTLHMFSSTVASILEKGPLIDALLDEHDVDEYDWLKNGNLLKQTIH